ncbi:GIY-YIG nuclease family protein [Vibrio vulnificus]|uniref:GIY-YIG nuclease family protein n=1 Tax=Vibrio vulnificus TaxID=672 RepID=UPI00102A301B|nr:GIY-YIG nuclease family protein [Vibrio vulnificus]EGQ8092045.1 GIY-YIG nuclease family protein [Vibrio vulnificus]EHH0745697.1 GIY-YIG nuclease family protein [Vibrio vulnificus]ELP8107257.1 GIY-YIG nuclease family protein [Vibrio vulnificus]MCA3881582.1 GIY-YIG nuclease family protein [Vibrio vulnificus]MCA3897980.1 GIY-YIG nuclease family protein [Vibrio vulnificus]
MSLPTLCPDWSVYLIRTRLNALYCGISNNVERRFCMHQQGKGAKALKGKGPLELVWSVPVGSKSMALKLERHIKTLRKQDKERLVKGDLLLQLDKFCD